MSHSLHQYSVPSANHNPDSQCIYSEQNGNVSASPNDVQSGTDVVCSSADRFLCTICVDSPDSPFDIARLPVCNHSFCLPCLASWSTIRQVCPNCKTPFTTALLRRDLDSAPISDAPSSDGQHATLEHPVFAICQASWVPLSEIHSAKHDIEASFSLPPREILASVYSEDAHQPASTSVPFYAHEDIEDELEDQFWEEEEFYHDRLMRGTRSISNRRFGPLGYMSAGRMRAAPCPSSSGAGSAGSHASHGKQNAKKEGKTKVQNKVVGSSSHSPGDHPVGQTALDQYQQPNNRSNTGGRKKKVKKKSRAGIAAAKAAAAENGNAQNVAVESPEQEPVQGSDKSPRDRPSSSTGSSDSQCGQVDTAIA